jgi:uncharacterized protein YjbI with pentapeptide repeats
MTFDPDKPAFAGKFQFRSTNGSGQKFLLRYTTIGGQTLPTVSSIRSTDPATVWTAYDAGSGSIVLVSEAGLYLSVQAGNYSAILVPDASAAAQVTLVPGVSGQVSVTWLDGKSGQTLTAYYQLGTGLPATLTFRALDPMAGLSALAQTTTTPGLEHIWSTKSAVGYDLTGVNLSRVSLAGVDCTRAHFDRAVLAGTVLSGATLTGAWFTGVDLTSVNWGQDISAGTANFSYTVGAGMVVRSSGKSGSRATFDSATFTGADWSGCDLAYASLHNAFLTGANFSGATLENGYLYSMQAGRSNDGKMPGADFSYAYMPDVDLGGANLDGADLSYAQLYFVDTGASLLNCNLTETSFVGADLSGASFGGDKTSLAGTRFDGAVLFDATFNGGTLAPSASGIPVTMAGAWLENATFSNVQFNGVAMSGARVAVSLPGGGAGVPLFAITSGVAGYVATLGRSQLPGAFTGPAGVFAQAGCVLSDAAQVSVVTTNESWMLTQPPTMTTLGIEDTSFYLVLDAGALLVATSGISLVEQGGGGSTYAVSYTVEATQLQPASLSADTRCPNHAAKATNDARRLSWRQMMTAPRPSLAVLDTARRHPGGRGRTP